MDKSFAKYLVFSLALIFVLSFNNRIFAAAVSTATSKATTTTPAAVSSAAPAPSSADILFDNLWNRTFHYTTLFESLNGYYVSGDATVDGSQLILATERKSGSSAEVSKTPNWQGVVTFSQRGRFRTTIAISNTDHVLAYFGLGNRTRQGYGFKIADGNLYGYSNDGKTEKALLLQPFNGGVYNLEARYKPNSVVVFYVDTILKGQITSNLPSAAKTPNRELLNIYLKTTDDIQKSLQTSYFEYLQMRNSGK